jgi:shikimate kinase
MPTEPLNLVLAGFMGTGKSTIGQKVAEQTECPFLDTDKEIERIAGRRIDEIFAASGEASFRSLEAHVCIRASQRSGQVIALGGGALLNKTTSSALAESGVIVCLTAPIDVILQRIRGGKTRPLASDGVAIQTLFSERADHYNRLPNQIDTSGKTVSQIVSEVAELWESQR